jgi:2',3'-cyclic-nucleotide 2'-phosphodiesterase (5'-nucleotidase family)
VLTSELLVDGGLRDRLAAPDDANLVLLYGGEQMGSMDTCGCPSRPRGSLARVDGYRAAMREASPGVPDLLLNPGNWLDDTIGMDNALRADVRVGNAWMLQALELGGWDALNVGFRDLPYLAETGAFPATSVSANVRPNQAGALAAAPWRVLRAGELRIAVTGVSPEGMTFLQPEGYHYRDPVDALRAEMTAMRAASDLVVVLAYGVGPDATRIAKEVPGIDVLVEAGEFGERYEPWLEDGVVWVRSHTQTQRLGELRLVVRDGRIVAARDRKIDLDDAVPETRSLAKMAAEAQDEMAAIQEELFGSW